MAYAIERDETLPASIRRIMDEQIVRARETLADSSLSVEKRVHEARKRFKETRALLRLVREPLGEHFAHENAWFRDAGRDLAAARDADAAVATLQKLALPKALERGARKIVEARPEEHPPVEPVIANVIDQLVIAQGRPGMWPDMEDSFDTIAGGLLRTYRDGRRDLRHHETPEELHDWRKRVKEHWYHVQLLRHVWPEMMKPCAEVLSTLSHALGDHHDLHVLREVLVSSPASPVSSPASPVSSPASPLSSPASPVSSSASPVSSPASPLSSRAKSRDPLPEHDSRANQEVPRPSSGASRLRRLGMTRGSSLGRTLTIIDTRQAELQSQAESIGARVYAEKPDAWLARMRKYWTAWLRTAR